jgi:lipopolysaccharide export LptBFGC system permease protein LptF
MAFDSDGLPLWSMEAPYAKIFPLVFGSSSFHDGQAVAVLFRALDRTDKNINWEPVIHGQGPISAQLSIAVSWDDFLLLSKIHQGLSGLSPAELRLAADKLGNYGYQREVFEAELLRRFSEPLFFLPFAIFAIVIGWRYRAMARPRYMGIPMMGILPAVFYGAEYISRGWINNLGIWAVVSLGFTSAAIAFGTGILVLHVVSLIILAAQHG